ncbi:MAG: N-acetyl-gamma-glutamyl-phosphate reductase [Proteobacteria bacterium]|nr:N-acetyl-gamma-glutamyl-phosphate reductase [Desulfobulbaceae bacterium]MBU4153774.1 N-acetyl-gamma-glutamyl-phosphate reductase [Pseudomonadota bacterium]
MIRVGIIGASGYTGIELSRLLCRHPGVTLTVATSRQYAGRSMADVYPSLRGLVDLVCEDTTGTELAAKADVFFTAVPHQTAMAIVPILLEAGKKVVDLSADFRIHDPLVYETWYQAHTAKELLGEAVYGLPEIHRHAIAPSRLVANPGCYPTSVILGLAPLLTNQLINSDSIIIDSKSGTSGAGRGAQVGSLYCEVTDGFKAYKVGEHRHTPEIEQELSGLCGQDVVVSFTPHLVPMSRGILSTMYATLSAGVTLNDVTEAYHNHYRNEPFVRLCPSGAYPATQYIRGGNFCDIGFKVDPRTGRIIVLSAIDNLVKGAAGQAVQNMNIICGFEETQGLMVVPLFP